MKVGELAAKVEKIASKKTAKVEKETAKGSHVHRKFQMSCSAHGAASLQMRLRAVVWVGVVFSILVLSLPGAAASAGGMYPSFWRCLYRVRSYTNNINNLIH